MNTARTLNGSTTTKERRTRTPIIWPGTITPEAWREVLRPVYADEPLTWDEYVSGDADE